jgi:hypothetical protein
MMVVRSVAWWSFVALLTPVPLLGQLAGAGGGSASMAQDTTAGPAGSPWDMPLFAAPAAPHATGHARLVYAASPFGVAVDADGRTRYDVEITAADLPSAESLGRYHAFVAFAVTPDLTQWRRLGAVHDGTVTVGEVDWNKFLLVIAASPDSNSTSHAGPTVLHGTSPSGWLQTFLSHPMFRGMAWGG